MVSTFNCIWEGFKMDFMIKVDAAVKRMLPKRFYQSLKSKVRLTSKSLKEANGWLKTHCANIPGNVRSIGSGDDQDGQGNTYRSYFTSAESYTTSEVVEYPGNDTAFCRASHNNGWGRIPCFGA